MLIGSYFTQEYALESAALFNPSMVWHPDQSGLEPGSRRFLVSLRATGEGHISSITFRSGTVDAECRIRMDEPTRFVTAPELVPNTLYDKKLFLRKLAELGVDGPLTRPDPGHARRPVHARGAPARHPPRPAPEPAATARARAGRPGDAHPGQGQLRDPLLARAARLGADHLPVVADGGQRHRGRPVRPVRRRRRLGPLLRDLYRLRRQGDPAADPRDRRLPAVPDQHLERPRGAEQGLRAVPAQGAAACTRCSRGRTTRTST